MAEIGPRLRDAVHGTPLESRLERFAEPFLARRSGDRSLQALADARLRGLARLLASHADCARYLAHRPELLERIASRDPTALDRHCAELSQRPRPDSAELEQFFDALRRFRGDETCLCGVLDLGGELDFEQASRFLSTLAETTLRWALEEATRRIEGRDSGASALAVVGMGKIAGRELTYHSDLDLVFLYARDRSPDPAPAAAAQRVISYLGTMTAAGIAYSVDARLRPSGRQGALVAECAAFEAYQRDKAATWEHLALTRARVLTPSPRAVEALRRAQHAVRRRPVWAEVEAMRERIVQERARPGVLGNRAESIAYKTGAGGLMDVEFLAQAGVLECGPSAEAERLPSIANLLHGAVRGAGSCALLERYHFLRVLEARNRWVSGRAVERLLCAGESTAAIAELVEPGLSIPALLERIEAARSGIRAAYDRAIAAGSIAALR